MDCPSDIFEKLWAVRGSGTYDEECVGFAYEAIGFHEWAGVHFLWFNNLEARWLKDWCYTDNWIQDLRVGLSIDEVFSKYSEHIYSEEVLPSDLIKDEKGMQMLVLETLRCQSKAGVLSWDDPGVACTEITNGNRTLFLVYGDCDSWILGHANHIDVIGDLSQLTEANGYYDLKSARPSNIK